MSKTAQARLKGLFSCFPQSPDITPEAYLAGLVMACEDGGDAAIIEAVENIVTGKAEGMNPNFCPSTAAFGVYARKLDEDNKIRQRAALRPRLEAPKPPEPFVQEGTEQERAAKVAAILGKFKQEK